MSWNQFNLSSACLIQLLICQQRSDVSHTLSVCLNNIWAGKLSAVWRVLVMDGSWLLPLSMKNTGYEIARLFNLYLLFSLNGSSPDRLPGFHLLLQRRDADGGKMIELALPSISSADERWPPQRSCHSNLSVIFGSFVLMDLSWLRAKQFSEVFADCRNVSTAVMTSLRNIPVDVEWNQKSGDLT